MFVRWQKSEIRKAHLGLSKLNSGLRSHKLCSICDCPRIEHAVHYTQEDCEIRRRLFGQDLSPGWHTVSVPVPGNKCSYGFELEDGRVLYETRLKAVLCESERVDGVPKQHHVAFLGSIEASWLESFYEGVSDKTMARAQVQNWDMLSIEQRYWFWQSVAEKLDSLEDRIPKGERRKLEDSVSEVVPRPTSREGHAVEQRANQIRMRHIT